MRKSIYMTAAAVFMCMVFPGFSQAQEKPLDVFFSPSEVESMLFLYNQTPVKGADVEIVAPVGAKLRAGLRVVRTQQDSTRAITIPMLPTEIQVCLGVINASTFEAKYAELVLGIKQKLEALVPSSASVQTLPEEKSPKKK